MATEVKKDRWLSPAQVCDDLEISRSKLHLELAVGTLRHYRLGRLIRIKESDLVAWLESKKVKS